MSGTICCIFLTSWTTSLFLAATKRSQESSSPGSPTAKAKACCLVSRHGVSVWQDCSSNAKIPVSTRDSQVWTWDERSAKSGWYSVQHASETESMVQKILEVSQRRLPRETESTCDKSFKTRKTDSDSMKASRKYRWTPRKCTFQYGRDLWLHRCRQHCTWIRVTKRFWKYSRILNVRTFKVFSDYENDDRRKFRN